MPILTIAALTLQEAARRRILIASLLCGVAFLTLFGIGFHFAIRGMRAEGPDPEHVLVMAFFTLVGLYATNFLTIMTAVLLPIDTLSGEIASGVMQTVASKPIRRSEIVLGKWLAYAVIVLGYLALMSGGIVAIASVLSGRVPPNLHVGLPLMGLEALVLMSLSIAGGTHFSTVTNGVVAFGFYGLAFLGGWVEQLGTLAGNDAARTIGTVASLLMPSESLWQLAAHHMQPALMRDLGLTPFSPVSIPSVAMVWWAVGFVAVTMAVGVRRFATRPL